MTFHACTVLAAALIAATTTHTASAHRVTLNDTGMTQCIDHHKAWSTQCAKSRQDADFGRDVDDADPNDGEAGFSFQKVCRTGELAGSGNCPSDPPLGPGPNDWGCTLDRVARLVWEVKTTDGGLHDVNLRYTNRGGKASDDPADASWLVDATNAESLCGSTDWRLPDAFELQSLVDYGNGVPGKGAPFVDLTFFPNTSSLQTWSRTEYFFDSKSAWYVHFLTGEIGTAKRFDFASARLVHRADRAQALTSRFSASVSDRFVLSPDGTEVKDTMTGLIWRRCAAGMAWNNDTQTCDGVAMEFSWKEALLYARANQSGGWRIPNVKELFSIADLETQIPTIDHAAFPNTPLSPAFLSSTPFDNEGTVALHTVLFFLGWVQQQAAYSPSNTWSLRLVRRGRE